MATCKFKGLSNCVECPLFSECELMDERCFRAEVDECDKHHNCEGCPATLRTVKKAK